MRNQTRRFLRSLARDIARTAADVVGIAVLMALGLAAFFFVCNLLGWGVLALLGEPIGSRGYRIGAGAVVLGCAYVVGALCHFAYVGASDARRWFAERWAEARQEVGHE